MVPDEQLFLKAVAARIEKRLKGYIGMPNIKVVKESIAEELEELIEELNQDRKST